jgi:hypothetical protein
MVRHTNPLITQAVIRRSLREKETGKGHGKFWIHGRLPSGATARFGPTTPTRATTSLAASVEPTEARKTNLESAGAWTRMARGAENVVNTVEAAPERTGGRKVVAEEPGTARIRKRASEELWTATRPAAGQWRQPAH